ncbi:hypothetical protein C2G38_338113 [Gigaspora rosea]|uniref:Uncharacterized protein n=1 Tax=Gigaspora rosea TaxID=44941 RepID=A0A397UE83_9GLOM|nr:hypothetical protein C2G38_338113 [Gigaspora rosea]
MYIKYAFILFILFICLKINRYEKLIALFFFLLHGLCYARASFKKFNITQEILTRMITISLCLK